MKDIGTQKRPYWTYHCECCLRCMGYCKNRAVEAGHSWAILLYYITSVPALAFSLAVLFESDKDIPIISNYWIFELINIVYILPALFISYWIFWYLIRFPVFNTLFSLTTLTHYYRRYHQPETKLKHLVNVRRKNARP